MSLKTVQIKLVVILFSVSKTDSQFVQLFGGTIRSTHVIDVVELAKIDVVLSILFFVVNKFLESAVIYMCSQEEMVFFQMFF